MKRLLLICGLALIGCQDEKPYTINGNAFPKKPLFIIETAVFNNALDGVVQYTAMDSNGKTFYFRELLKYPDYQPRFTLGDTLR